MNEFTFSMRPNIPDGSHNKLYFLIGGRQSLTGKTINHSSTRAAIPDGELNSAGHYAQSRVRFLTFLIPSSSEEINCFNKYLEKSFFGDIENRAPANAKTCFLKIMLSKLHPDGRLTSGEHLNSKNNKCIEDGGFNPSRFLILAP